MDLAGAFALSVGGVVLGELAFEQKVLVFVAAGLGQARSREDER